MSAYRFSHGDVGEALSIMTEAAQWLISRGEPLWLPEDLGREVLRNPAEQFSLC